MMNDNEIIQVFKEKVDFLASVTSVYLDENEGLALYQAGLSALDLINRQQAEKEALIAGQETMSKYIEEQQAEIERLENGIEELNCKLDMANDCIPQQRAEAVKEFAERLKKAKQYSLERHENIVPVAVIDWIVKEMEGDTE